MKIGQCSTCKHRGNEIESDVCRGCYIKDEGGATNWEPEAPDCVTADWYQAQAMRTAEDQYAEKSLVEAALGLTGETGECVEIIKKHIFQGHDLETDKLIGEIGDVLWYAALLAWVLGVSLGEIMMRSVEKLRERYPDGFDPERSRNREEDGRETESEP